MTKKTTSIKPHLDRWRTQIASIEADGRLSSEDKANIFQVLEGLIQIPSHRWAMRAKREREQETQDPPRALTIPSHLKSSE